MRLRHKKNAETEVYDYPIVINIDSMGELCEPMARNGGYFEPSSFFNNQNSEIHIELGMGKGRFVTELAKLNQNINYIGIEKSATIVLKAIDRLSKANGFAVLTPTVSPTPMNLRFMCIDIAKLGDIFAPHSINKIYLNFSDPWPKKRHETRRLTHHNFLVIYETLLKSGGTVEFKTDNKDLFDFSLEEIKNSNFKLLEFTYDLHNDPKLNEGNIMTEYEEKFSKLGNKICKLIIESK